VAREIADAIPKLMTFDEHMDILAAAGVAWAQAALVGRDATAEFNATMAEGIGAEAEAARIRREASEERVAALEAELEMLLKARDAGQEVYQSHIDMARAELEAAEAELELAGATERAAEAAEASLPPWERHAAGLYDAQEAAETLAMTEAELAESVWRANMRIRKGGADIYEYRRGLLVSQDQVDPLQEIIALNEQIPSLMADNEQAVKSMGDTWEDTWNNLRSAVESALKATSVTALDMGLTDIGLYEEKWDENARRLDAIAARGFAELEAHPDWAGMLEIPPEVLQAGEEALKSWAQQTSAAVRNLTRPDLLNIDAAVAAVEQYFRDQAAKELSLDIITEAVLAKGIVGGADAKEQVAKALGLEEPTLSLGLELDPAQMEGLSTEGQTAVSYIMAGYKSGLDLANPAAELGQRFLEDVREQEGLLARAGTETWKPIWEAIKDSIWSSPFAQEIASAVSPHVAQILMEQGVFG
jgi:hypothetical protein